MKDQETRQKFIKLRAEGNSFSKIANELDISKATCSEWQKQYEKATDDPSNNGGGNRGFGSDEKPLEE